jgi:hypothetical protein
MQNVPKIVRERLRAATPVVNHPDADVLTAFAERSLPDLERAVVFEHLARCGDCRDIVALAVPAIEPVEPAVSPSPSGWLTWPVLRWGFVAAGVVAIAWFGVRQYQRGSQPATVASQQTAPLEVAANEPKKAVAQFVAPAPAEKKSKFQSPAAGPAFTDSVETTKAVGAKAEGANAVINEKEKKNVSQFDTLAALPRPRSSAGAVGGPIVANQWQQQNAIQNQAPASVLPAPDEKRGVAAPAAPKMQVPSTNSEVIEVESSVPQVNPLGRNAEALKIQDLPAAEQPTGEDYGLAHVDKAKPVMTTQAAKSAPAAPKTVIAGAVLASHALIPLWIITSTGGLQRSFDQGSTWQDVDVNSNAGSFHGAVDLEAVAKSSRTQEKDADKTLRRETAQVTFRAVAAAGGEVWAGGSAGALYHSVDAGNHWTSVVPATAGTILTGDILSVEFPDPQHGKVSTSTAEVWTTSDDGQTWRKR